MEPEGLKHLRKSRGLTRKALAEILDCSESAIVKWEEGSREIPSWVPDKLFREVELTLPIELLTLLVNHAAKKGMSFEELLTEAIREHLNQLVEGSNPSPRI